MRIIHLCGFLFMLGCLGGSSSDGTLADDQLGNSPMQSGGQQATPEDDNNRPCAIMDGVCDASSLRAIGCGPYTCKTAPEALTLTGTETDPNHQFRIFKYEASHPLATAMESHPCSQIPNPDPNRSVPLNYQAADAPTEPCSVAGVIPWHTVRFRDAQTACESIGWRLCTREEFLRACQGPSRNAYPYGSTFEGGRCNVNSTISEIAKTGQFSGCESDEGGFDLNGNLWEWTSHTDPQDSRARFYQGAGWKIVAERHQAVELRCETDTRLPGLSAPTYQATTVGFRCCQDAD